MSEEVCRGSGIAADLGPLPRLDLANWSAIEFEARADCLFVLVPRWFPVRELIRRNDVGSPVRTSSTD